MVWVLSPPSPRRDTTSHTMRCLGNPTRDEDNQKSDLYLVIGPLVTLLGWLKVVQSGPLLWCYAVAATAARSQRKR